MLGIVLLVIGVLVGVALIAAFRRPWESRRPVEPPMTPPRYRGAGRAYGYGQRGYGRPYGYGEAYGYERPRRSGMSPGAAGALGAVGGGLLGYELGQMQGEHGQFHQDEMMMDRRDDDVVYADADQGNWPVDEDGPFNGGFFDDGGGADFDGSW